MWSRIVVAFSGLAIAAEILGAADILGGGLGVLRQAEAQSPAASMPVLASDSRYALLLHDHWLRMEVIGGQLTLINGRCGNSRTAAVGTEHDAVRQNLAIQLHPNLVVVHFESHADGDIVSVDSDREKRLVIERREAGADEPLLLYRQETSGKVELVVRESGEKQVYTAPSFWHLLLSHEEVATEQLIPLLEAMRPHWQLAEQVRKLRRHMVSMAGSSELAAREQWLLWVKDLASNDFPTRQLADRKLRSAGQAVISVLSRIPSGELDAEQRRRIRTIISDLRDQAHDTPERVASWMIDDPTAWISLLDSDQTLERRHASEQLTLLLGEVVSFDPLAPRNVRDQQIVELRLRHLHAGR
ncbi:hypothetical protein Psta_2201 [Pirellula staleyi DSM 6068]|uniref:Uncharacterized protein n=1 Tax=Pirellula staleyi (strain ATCC 27377 / DSM 6068 / ICPB 4128) TaxID=530564 RepID=D2R2N2_PIRSD|nr:hypothetical protein [Pirellula staleyi]ADB16872.1 hypothetical protein Psta_2201 [Pirellula staleyi DSM 6068]